MKDIEGLLMKYILLILLASCIPSQEEIDIQKIQNMKKAIHRYENEEVICYIYKGYYKGGISCKFK